jgi:4-hydroxybutyrate dehydrogenase/sulfolactaldehyde 3-reductase
MKTIGFIGLGAMGRPMARNALKGGFALRVHDIVPEAVEALRAAGAEVRPSPREVARDADGVITMLPDSPDVEAVMLGPDGVAAGARAGTYVIDMSTIDPSTSKRVGQALRARGLRFVDAPVGRTAAHAEAGTLLVMIGGEPADVRAVEPLLRTMGSDLVHCGPPGSGITMKVVNNYLSCAASVLTAECLVLGVKAGLDLETMLRVMTGTAAKTAHLEMTYPAKAFRGDFTPGFLIDLAHKDLGLALRLGGEERVPLAMGAVAREIYSHARARGKGRLDYSGIVTLLEETAGVEVRRGPAGRT